MLERNKDIPLPTYAHDGDACCDLYAQSIEYDAKKIDILFIQDYI